MVDTSLFASPSHNDIERSLAFWPSISGKLKPHSVSAFGDVFYQRPDGTIHRLDPLEGSVTIAATSVEQFKDLLKDKDWLDGNLMPELIKLATERGIARDPHQVFAFAPHPVFTGALRVEQMIAMDLPVWHGIASQLFEAEAEENSDK